MFLMAPAYRQLTDKFNKKQHYMFSKDINFLPLEPQNCIFPFSITTTVV